MTNEDRVRSAVERTFPEERVEEALDILASYGIQEREHERVLLAIVTLSVGDIGKLRHFTKVAKTDYRDVLYWAEYSDK